MPKIFTCYHVGKLVVYKVGHLCASNRVHLCLLTNPEPLKVRFLIGTPENVFWSFITHVSKIWTYSLYDTGECMIFIENTYFTQNSFRPKRVALVSQVQALNRLCVDFDGHSDFQSN